MTRNGRRGTEVSQRTISWAMNFAVRSMDIRAPRASIWGDVVAAVVGSLLVLIALWLWGRSKASQ